MTLIDKVRTLKVFYRVSYSSIASELGIRTNSFYNWMRGTYNLSEERQKALQRIIDRYMENDTNGQNT